METPVYGIIYGLFFPNGGYIGQTIQGEIIRWKEHLRDTNAGSTLPVHNAIRKHYNKDETQNNVKRIIIDKAYSLEELNNLETKYIIEYNTFNGNNPKGYNMTMGGDGCKGYKFTEEQKENCRKIQQKRKEEHPEKQVGSEINNKNFTNYCIKKIPEEYLPGFNIRYKITIYFFTSNLKIVVLPVSVESLTR